MWMFFLVFGNKEVCIFVFGFDNVGKIIIFCKILFLFFFIYIVFGFDLDLFILVNLIFFNYRLVLDGGSCFYDFEYVFWIWFF